MMHSFTEENYLKAIYHLGSKSEGPVATNSISEAIGISAASVTDMLKKLAEKGLIDYIRYQGVKLTEQGRLAAVAIIRKHRLWEVFLVEKLGFKWDEVHDIAEELEHIKSEELVNKLDEFLGRPRLDPHGDPIPNEQGEFSANASKLLADLQVGESGNITAVCQHTPAFLQYLEQQGLLLGTHIELEDTLAFDGSLKIRVNQQQHLIISREAAQNLLILP